MAEAATGEQLQQCGWKRWRVAAKGQKLLQSTDSRTRGEATEGGIKSQSKTKFGERKNLRTHPGRPRRTDPGPPQRAPRLPGALAGVTHAASRFSRSVRAPAHPHVVSFQIPHHLSASALSLLPGSSARHSSPVSTVITSSQAPFAAQLSALPRAQLLSDDDPGW